LHCPVAAVSSDIVLTRRITARDGASIRVTMAGLMLGVWLGLVGLATFPQLHHLLHSDSSTPSHECCITQVAKSQFLAPGGLVGIAALVVAFFKLPFIFEPFLLPAIDLRIASPRGPPIQSFLL